jgi:SAM-dependent methyltransferase
MGPHGQPSQDGPAAPAYDLLAAHYDAVTGDCAAEAAFLRAILTRRHEKAVTLLDLACGTGGITARLASAYRVSGLDISPGMLALARAKLPPGTPLYLADLASFDLAARFDAVVCAYQGINHLLGFPAWERCFGRVYAHLSDGGVFVFDIATAGSLIRQAGGPKMVQRFGDNYLLLTVRTTDGAVFEWHIEVYELHRDGSYGLIEQSVAMTSFPLTRIREALDRRFADVEVLDGAGRPAGDDQGDRIWFACSRPRPGHRHRSHP